MNLIKINNLNVSYKVGYKNISVLKNITFQVNSSEYICIVGNNGSGKSTLIKSLLGLIPVYKGQILKNCQKDEISYLPQSNSIPINFPATVEEIILSGTQNTVRRLPFYTKENKTLAQKAMEKAEVSKFSKRRFWELSGGQQQRVLFARAIAKNPKILILDEPCTGLDPVVSESFYKLLSKTNSEQKTTIIMVSHDLHSVKKYASKVLVLNKELLFCGSVRDWDKYRNGGDTI